MYLACLHVCLCVGISQAYRAVNKQLAQAVGLDDVASSLPNIKAIVAIYTSSVTKRDIMKNIMYSGEKLSIFKQQCNISS